MNKLFRLYPGHYSVLLRLGLPIVIGQLGMIVLGFTDTLMVGRYNTDSLGAASFVNNMINLVVIFGTGFSYGLTPVIGGLFGRGKMAEAGQALKNSILANLLVGALIALCMLLCYWNVDRLGQPAELIPLIKPYFLILISSLPFVMLFNAFKQFADGITDTKTAMWILLGGNLLNIIGNYLLIYGAFGFPELGLYGAGISTLFSRIVMVLVFALLFRFHARFSPYRAGFFQLGFSRSSFKELNHLGWPVALQMGMESASFSLSAIMVGWLGTIALASHQIMITISTLGYMIYYGMGAAIAIRVSYFRGQNDWSNIRGSAFAGYHILLLLTIVFCVALFLCRNFIAHVFTSDEMVHQGVLLLVMPMLLYQFGDSLQIAFANALRGISDVKPMIFIAFIAYFVISLPLGYLLGFVVNWGILGIWMAFPFGLTTAGVMLLLRFKKKLNAM